MALREVRKFIPEGVFPRGGFWEEGFSFVGTIQQILIRPTNLDTIYNVGIRDEQGMLIWAKFNVEGELFTEEELGLILFPGEKRIILDDVAVDEPFTVKVIYQL